MVRLSGFDPRIVLLFFNVLAEKLPAIVVQKVVHSLTYWLVKINFPRLVE